MLCNQDRTINKYFTVLLISKTTMTNQKTLTIGRYTFNLKTFRVNQKVSLFF